MLQILQKDSYKELQQEMIDLVGVINEKTLPGRNPEFYDFLKNYKPIAKTDVRQKIGPELRSESTLELIERLVVLDPSKRLTAEEALQHGLFTVLPNRSENLLSIIKRL